MAGDKTAFSKLTALDEVTEASLRQLVYERWAVKSRRGAEKRMAPEKEHRQLDIHGVCGEYVASVVLGVPLNTVVSKEGNQSKIDLVWNGKTVQVICRRHGRVEIEMNPDEMQCDIVILTMYQQDGENDFFRDVRVPMYFRLVGWLPKTEWDRLRERRISKRDNKPRDFVRTDAFWPIAGLFQVNPSTINAPPAPVVEQLGLF